MSEKPAHRPAHLRQKISPRARRTSGALGVKFLFNLLSGLIFFMMRPPNPCYNECD